MQKQKLDTHYFLTLQATYEGIELALCSGERIVRVLSLSKFDASRLLIVALDQLLGSENLKISDLSFLAVNQGPGPFTTLRTVLATVNGLAFAAGIPLIGVDGLAAFLDEVRTNARTLVMLNAFNKDVYYAYACPDIPDEYGCMAGDRLLAQIASYSVQQQLTVVGNAVALWKSELETECGDRLQIPDQIPQTVSIAQVARVAYAQWQGSATGVSRLMPIYLKQHSAVLAG